MGEEAEPVMQEVSEEEASDEPVDDLGRAIADAKRKLISYKGISFFIPITTPDFLCIQYAPFKATSSTFNPF